MSRAINWLYHVLSIDLGAIISIQETEISIIEGNSGEICIVLENVAGGLERNISLTLTTTTGTAGTKPCYVFVCALIASHLKSRNVYNIKPTTLPSRKTICISRNASEHDTGEQINKRILLYSQGNTHLCDTNL